MWKGKIWRGIQKLSLQFFVLHEFIHAHCSRILECPLDRGVWRIHLVNETIFDWMSLQIRSLLFEWYINISLGLCSVAKGHIKDPTIAKGTFSQSSRNLKLPSFGDVICCDYRKNVGWESTVPAPNRKVSSNKSEALQGHSFFSKPCKVLCFSGAF